MDKQKVLGYGISVGVAVLLFGGIAIAGTMKQKAAEEDLNKTLNSVRQMGFDVTYKDLDTSIFNNDLVLSDVSLSGDGYMALAAMQGMPDVAKPVHIEKITVRQNIPLTEVEQSVSRGQTPKEMLIGIESLDADLDLEKIAMAISDPKIKGLIKSLNKALGGEKPSLNLRLGYEKDAHGVEDVTRLTSMVSVNDRFKVDVSLDVVNVEMVTLAMMTGADILRLGDARFRFEGDRDFNQSMMLALADEPDSTNYADFSSREIDAIKGRSESMDPWVVESVQPEIFEFLEAPRSMSFAFSPKEPVSVKEIMDNGPDEDLLKAIKVKAN